MAPPLTLILLGSMVEGLHIAQHHRGERLVELEQVDVGERHAGPFQHLLGDVDRAGEHDRRLGADIGEGAHAGPRLQARPLAGPAVAEQHRGGAVDDAGGIAGMMDVFDVFDFRMRLNGDGIEAAHLSHLHERRV